MYALILMLNFAIPGPISTIKDSAGVAEDVVMTTSTFRMQIGPSQATKADCETLLSSVSGSIESGGVFTDANGNQYPIEISPNNARCLKQGS